MAFPRPYGRYILEDRLAMGGMAEIFRARTAQAGFEKRVCIKRVLPHFLEEDDFVTMFRDEAKTAARLQHANVVQVFDFGEVEEESGTTLFLAMELIEGADLRRLADQSRKKKRPFTIGEVTQIGIDVCRGLHHAHQLKDEHGVSLGIVHRDISPHNILVSRQGEVKITDFGIAKAAERATHTSTGIVKGKVAYMSPEQAEGKAFDHRLDQWALGVVLWELLCGERLFRGENDATILRKVLNVEVPPPSSRRDDVPRGLEDIILKSLAGTPDERFRDMREMELALSRFMFSGAVDPASAEVSAAYARIMDGDAPPTPRRTAVLDVPELARSAANPVAPPAPSPAPPWPPAHLVAAAPPLEYAPTIEMPPPAASVVSSTDELRDESQVFVSSERHPVAPPPERPSPVPSLPTQLVDNPAEFQAAAAAFEQRPPSSSRKNALATAVDGREPSRPSRRSPVSPTETAIADGALLDAERALATDGDDGTPATRTLIPAEQKSGPQQASLPARVPLAPPPPQPTASTRTMVAAAAVVAVGAAAGLFIAFGGSPPEPVAAPVNVVAARSAPTPAPSPSPSPEPVVAAAAPASPIQPATPPATTATATATAAAAPPAATTTAVEKPASKPAETSDKAEAPKAPGFVYVDVIDAWALVSIGKKPYGETPLKITLTPGRYTITLTSGDGTKKKNVPVTVTSGGKVQVRETF